MTNVPIDSDVILERLEQMQSAIRDHAKSKSERIYIEQFRKSKKALLMRSDEALDFKTVNEREQYAYSHPEYLELLEGLRDAIEIEEKHKWALYNLQMQVEVWRSMNANSRAMQSQV